MHPHLRARHLAPPLRARLADLLRVAPWCWPKRADAEALDRAAALARLDRAPALDPGSVLLVSVQPHAHTATLWALSPQRRDALGAGRSPRARPALGEACLLSWHRAALALPRSVPVVWTSIHAAAATQPALEHVETLTEDGKIAPHPASVDGPSFGLAFVLSLASSALGAPLPDDLIASARVQPSGRLGRISGLEAKLVAVARLAPRVVRFFVARAQADEARAIVARRGLDLTVVAASSAGEALEEAYGRNLARLLIEQIHDDPARRDAILDALFRLTLGERVSVLDWTPVYEAATLLMERLQGALSPGQRYRLHFAHAVASRHEGQPVELEVPTAGVLAQLPRPLRVDLLAHLTQNSADGAHPSRADLAPLIERYTPNPHEATDRELKLLGALARVDAHTGHPSRALETQRQLALAWFARFAHDQAAYPLTEWLRLSGALQARASFDEAAEALERYRFSVPRNAPGHAYLNLAYHRGALFLGVPCDAHLSALEDLARSPSHPAPLRRATARCLIAALQRQGAAAQHQAALAALVGELGASDADRHLLALLALDALEGGAAPGAALEPLWAACAIAHDAEEPARHALDLIPPHAQPFGQLARSFASRDDGAQRAAPTLAEYIRRFYPY